MAGGGRLTDEGAELAPKRGGLGPAKVSIGQLFLVFSFIGLTTIGGGYAMVPLIQQQVVSRRRWLEEDDFVDLLALAQAAPGIMAVNVALIVGYRLKGPRGALVAALGAALPSFLIILVVAAGLGRVTGNSYLAKFFQGARPAAVALVFYAALTLGRSALKSIWAWLVAGTAGVLFLAGLHPVLVLSLSALLGVVLYYQGKE